MADVQQESKDLQVCVRSLQEKMDVINQVTFCCLVVLNFNDAITVINVHFFFRYLVVSTAEGFSLKLQPLHCVSCLIYGSECETWPMEVNVRYNLAEVK